MDQFNAWLQRQPVHVRNAIRVALLGIVVEAILVVVTLVGVFPSWGPVAIVGIAFLVIAGGVWKMPENSEFWGD